jgi:Skp family chaperone for outer membrane proteins
MNRTTRHINVPTVSIVLILGAIAGYQALAQRGGTIPAPVIATVRMEPLFDGLQQRAEAKTEIAAIEQEIADEQARRRAIIDEKELELEDVVAAATRETLSDEISLERLKLQFWYQEAVAELEVEKALRLQDLYKSVKQALAEVAEAEGYDIVLLNDSNDALPFERDSRMPAQLQILQQIASRKCLYLNPAFDVTDDLIVRMNNAYRAAQAGP